MLSVLLTDLLRAIAQHNVGGPAAMAKAMAEADWSLRSHADIIARNADQPVVRQTLRTTGRLTRLMLWASANPGTVALLTACGQIVAQLVGGACHS